MVLLLGECRVEYQGRARSRLGWGERLVVVKKDGSVLVHQGVGREPVNWQPPGAMPIYHLRDGLLVVRAQRARELMKIEFRRIDLLVMKALSDGAELRLAGMEEDLVKAIMDDPSVIEDGMRVLRRELRTRSGSVDLFCKDRAGRPVIVEVKRGTASIAAVYQLEAYVADFKRKNGCCDVRGVLVANRIPIMLRTLLRTRGLEHREVNVRVELEGDLQTRLGAWIGG